MVTAQEYDKKALSLRRLIPDERHKRRKRLEIVRLATLAASSHNTQPWKFWIGQDSITIYPDFSRRCPVVDPDDSHLFKSLGCAAENCVHAASALGLHASVQYHQENEQKLIVLLTSSAAVKASHFYPMIIQRQCVKKPYDGASLSSSILRSLEEAGRGKGVRTLLLTSPEKMNAVADLIWEGNMIQLTDKAFRCELISWLRFSHAESIRKGDGLAGRPAGHPSVPRWLGKIMMNLVLTPRSQATADLKNIQSSAGVAVFIAEGDGPGCWVESGRVYERFALQASALNVRTAFINQPLEVRPLRSQFESWLNLRKGEHAHLMVRFGTGTPAPYSLRRPLEEVLLNQEQVSILSTSQER